MKMAEYTVTIKHECTSCGDSELTRLAEELPDAEELAEVIALKLPAGCERAAVFVVVLGEGEQASG